MDEPMESTDESEAMSPRRKKRCNDAMEVITEIPIELSTENRDDTSISHPEVSSSQSLIPTNPVEMVLPGSFDSSMKSTDESEGISPSRKKMCNDAKEVTTEIPAESSTENRDDRIISHPKASTSQSHIAIYRNEVLPGIFEYFDSFNIYKNDDCRKPHITNGDTPERIKYFSEIHKILFRYRSKISCTSLSESSSSDESDDISLNMFFTDDVVDLDMPDGQEKRNKNGECVASTLESSEPKLTLGMDSLDIGRLPQCAKSSNLNERNVQTFLRCFSNSPSFANVKEVNSTEEKNLTRDLKTPADSTSGDIACNLESLKTSSLCPMYNSLEDNHLLNKSIIPYKNVTESASNTEFQSCTFPPCTFPNPANFEFGNFDDMTKQLDDMKRERIGPPQNSDNSLEVKDSYFQDTSSSMVIDEVSQKRRHATMLSEDGESNGSYTGDVAEQKRTDATPLEENNTPEHKKARYSFASR